MYVNKSTAPTTPPYWGLRLGELILNIFHLKEDCASLPKVRLFSEGVNSMGGMTDQVALWLPSSEIGQYHVRENREYYMRFFEDLRQNFTGEDVWVKSGIPSVFSWLHELKAHTEGLHEKKYQDSDPFTAQVRSQFFFTKIRLEIVGRIC